MSRNKRIASNSDKKCDHPVVMKDMCACCGKNLRTRDGLPGDRLVKTDASVAMIHSIPELVITMEEAKQLGAADEENVLKQKKLVLLVDLDQTLVHTTNEDVDPNLKDVYHFQLYGSNSPWYHVRLRPNTAHFLQTMKNMYEMHICSFGARIYAHKIASILDPDGTIFGHRILSRDECFDSSLKTANLKALFPCGDRLVCVIDDREDVWNFASNVVQVKPYRYFKNTGDINAPSGFTKTERNTDKHYRFAHPKKSAASPDSSQKTKKRKVVVEETDDEIVIADVDVEDYEKNEKEEVKKIDDKDDDDDDYLYYLEEILTRIYTAFYQLYDRTPSGDRPPDLHSVIPYVKLKVLKNVNLVFSAVIPTNVRPEDSLIYNVAKNFGASIQENIVAQKLDNGPPLTTHLVAGKWGTNKVKDARSVNGIKIVTPQWLWCCAERWERVEEDLFPLTKDTDYTKIYSNSVEETLHKNNNNAVVVVGQEQQPSSSSSLTEEIKVEKNSTTDDESKKLLAAGRTVNGDEEEGEENLEQDLLRLMSEEGGDEGGVNNGDENIEINDRDPFEKSSNDDESDVEEIAGEENLSENTEEKI